MGSTKERQEELGEWTKRMVKGFSVTRELAIFSVKREIKNLIHVNCNQGHFRDS